MKAITKYKAIDGAEFDTEEKCIEREGLIDKINTIMSMLPSLPKDDGFKFVNGNGYIQHDKKLLFKVRIKLLNLMKPYIRHGWIDDTIKEKLNPSWVGRLLSDCNIIPLYDAWFRFMCIDKKHREWGQLFYADHAEERVEKEIIFK